MKYLARLSILSLVFMTRPSVIAQSRINFNNQELFISGANIAWINFARDIGPGATDFDGFANMFQEVHESGGNSMLFWLHTNGANTPEFNNGVVISPGEDAISDLIQILDLAWEREVGLILTLWTHDMLRTSFGPDIYNRNRDLLMYPWLTEDYINNALIPMVAAVEDHPAIIAWNIICEPEGISNEYGWDGWQHVTMSFLQRFINMCAGAIHRTDPRAQVTVGSLSLFTLSDVDGNYNYYTDERLIAAGGDSSGYLDFYSVHFYDWAGISLSPFHHPYSYWNLDKPLIISEFFMEDTYSIPYSELYENLYDNGYAGAETWQWYDGEPDRTRMLAAMQSMFEDHPEEVDIIIPAGFINYFRADPSVIELGQSSTLTWATSNGSLVTLDGVPVTEDGSQIVSPDTTTTYILIAQGDIIDTSTVTVQLFPSGIVLSFSADPPVIEQGFGQSSILSWTTTGGSSVTLDGVPIDEDGSEIVSPDTTTTYFLIAQGENIDTSVVTLQVLPPWGNNIALNRPVEASSIESVGLEPEFAVDGDTGTRWSSVYSDPQWIYVDLGQTVNVNRVILNWETAYGKSYQIQISGDAINWDDIFSTETGDGGIDDLTGLSDTGRYVRMYGTERGTQWGYSLWEFEVYGTSEGNWPPFVNIIFPSNGATFAENVDITIVANTSDDHNVTRVDFFANDSSLGLDSIPGPYSLAWSGVSEGNYFLTAMATDDSSSTTTSAPVYIFVGNPPLSRFEAENATFTGDISVAYDSQASNGAYANMLSSGTITWDIRNVPHAGQYLLMIGYRLPYSEKIQYLVINGNNVGEIIFDSSIGIWQDKTVIVNLNTGDNTIAIEKYWGWTHFDFIELPISLRMQPESTMPDRYVLHHNYPNPFNSTTTIHYAIPNRNHVNLVIYDILGRKVKTLINQIQERGDKSVIWDATNNLGKPVSTGIYLYQVRAGEFMQTRKMVVVK